MKSIFSFFLTVLIISSSAQDLDTRLEDAYQSSPFVGFAASKVSDQGVDYLGAFGFMDSDQKRAYSLNTVQPIASVSKTFIGLALMKCIELGKISLDDPINEYLPYQVVNPRFPDEPILVRHLVSHTSSIRDRGAIYRKSYVKQDEYEELLSEFLYDYFSEGGQWNSKKNYTKERPGSGRQYSNIASALLAQVLDNATNVPFSAFCAEHIFKPLEMENTTWFYDLIDPAQHTDLHKNSGKKIPMYSLDTYPDGGLRTNVIDLSKYLHEMIRGYSGNGKLLSQESYKTLFEPIHEANGKKTAVFWSTNKSGEIGHTGGDPGVSAFCFFDPETLQGRVVLINGEVENKKRQEDFLKIWNLLGE